MGVLFPKINDESRVLELNSTEYRLRGNKIDTAKYSVVTFLPKSLLLQFTRLSNVVFLANAVLQSIPIISTISPLTAIGPLAFVLSLSMLREGYEDYVLREGEFRVVEWDQVRPGDFVKILNGEVVPADTLLLVSSSEAGICYVETANLDGESNLKEKRTVTEISHLSTGQLEALRGTVTAEKPTPNLYEFSGKA
ncbi:uncharacterized protein LOC116245034 [Nymphaea colorata]|nr:uncharacterized protein LOC116245034 [Nymphaea colorata]